MKKKYILGDKIEVVLWNFCDFNLNIHITEFDYNIIQSVIC